MIEQQSNLFLRDDTILSAWNSQLAEAARTPLLSRLFLQRRDELLPRFAKSYVQLRALPRRTRRALQRRLARSCELTHIARERMHRPDGRALQHKLAWSLAGAALLLALGQGVQAATITVNTTNADINIGDGKCSLSEAIINANDTITGQPIADCGVGNPAGADTIQLSAGTHTISTPYSNAALPPITSQITIEGNNAKIARKRTAPPATVIVTTSSGDLILKNVTVTGGYYLDGGGVFNAGSLTLDNSTISGNQAFAGGGIFNTGTLTIENNSKITKNTAFYYGGGIADSGGTTTLENSTISSNTAKSLNSTTAVAGGGMITASSNVTITDSIITGNKAGNTTKNTVTFGAGVANGTGSSLTIQNSTVASHTATAFYYASGGGISNRGTLTVNNSTIEKGQATFGAGIYNGSGASSYVGNSTISQNLAKTKPLFYAFGGGLDNEGGTLVVVNSTISGNKADTGGGINNFSGGSYLTNTTITKNNAKFYGGGVFNLGLLALGETLISGNKIPVSGFGPEVSNLGSTYANYFNLFGANGSSGASGVTIGATDIVPAAGVTTTKVLSPTLKHNVGPSAVNPTKTHALVTGSPAIDAAPCIVATDQRGVPRPVGAACDIGAFEGPP